MNSGSDHKGIPFAIIALPELKRQVYSDSTGYFELCGLPVGKHTLVIHFPGYDTLIVEAESGKNRKFIFHLHEKDHWLDAIDVKGKHRHFESEVVEAEAIHKEELERGRGVSLGELVTKIQGVAAIQTGPTLFKPVIQGMTGQRIAILQNGVKLEGQQWGFDHAPETDPGLADEIIVVKGAQAIRFGADAIGGAILMEPGDFSSSGKLEGKWTGGYASNGRGVFQTLSLEKSHGEFHRISWRIRTSAKKSGSFSTPVYVLGNTALQEWSGQGILRYEYGAKWKTELVYSTFINKTGIFSGSHFSSPEGIRQAMQRPDSSYQYRFSYRIGRPFQKINHQFLKAGSDYVWNNHHQTQIVASYQKDQRSEFDLIRTSGPGCKDCPQLYFELATHQIEINHRIRKEGMDFRFGATGTYQWNIVERRLLIPNFRLYQTGSYGIASLYVNKWAFEAGGRVDYRKQQIFRYLGNEFDQPVRLFLNYMLNAGVRYQISDHWHTKLNLQSTKRAPNVSELYSNGVHQGSASFERGSENLVSEQLLNASFSIHHQSENWGFLLNAFETHSNNFIYLSPVGDSIITNIRGPFPFFQYNQSQVRLRGVDAFVSWQFLPKWQITGKGALIRGWNHTDQQHLIFQPADRIGTDLKFTTGVHKSGYALEVMAGPQWVARQKRVPEKIDFAPPPPAYMLWNARISLQKTTGRFRFDASVEGRNLANLAYRDYMNRFRYYAYDLGRNLTFRINIPF